MLISMTPNEEVKTIHASLNDGKLRKWEFEPYTEQGKIELTDQDYATIQSIKGNTVKFNQLARYTNKANATVCGLTITNNNNGSFTINGTFEATGDRNMYAYISAISVIQGHKYLIRSTGSFMAGFVFGSASGNQDATTYIVTASSSGNMETSIRLIQSKATNGQVVNETIWINTFDLTAIFGSGNEPTTVSDFETWLSNNIGLLPYYDYTPGTLIPFKGTGLKTTGKNLLPLSIEQIKQINTVGTWNGNSYSISGITFTLELDNNNQVIEIKANGTATADWIMLLLPLTLSKGSYILNGISGGANTTYRLDTEPLVLSTYDGDGTIGTVDSLYNGVLRCVIRLSGYVANDVSFKPMVRFADISDDTFEPFTSNTLSLPISTLFPTGMKSAGSVYDELTESKAITRIRRLTEDDFVETVSDGVSSGGLHWAELNNASIKLNGSAICNLLPVDNATAWLSTNPVAQIGTSANRIRVYGTFTSLEEFKAQYPTLEIFYELATPISQDISLDLTYPVWDDGTEQILPINGSTPTTAPLKATIDYPDRTEDVNFLYKQTTFESAIPQFSLVCKNQELPMTLENDKLICECDSSITNESGFFDCKVKMQDLDSVAYSQKIQLHVERGIND